MDGSREARGCERKVKGGGPGLGSDHRGLSLLWALMAAKPLHPAPWGPTCPKESLACHLGGSGEISPAGLSTPGSALLPPSLSIP